MTTDANEVTVEFLEAFAKAWNRHDIEDLMSFMTDDCIYDASSGVHEWGTRYEGVAAVREGYIAVWNVFPDAKWNNDRHFVCGNRGLSEWTFTGTNAEGKKIAVAGCDIFTFRDGKIVIKDTFRKIQPL